MNEERRDKLAKQHSEKRGSELSAAQYARESVVALSEYDFRAGWNACYAEMTTKRSEPEWHDILMKGEQTRD